MPIFDIEIVCETEAEFSKASARVLADALGKTLGTATAHTWVRLRYLNASAYAENDTLLTSAELPVFVTLLHAHLPTGQSLATELAKLTTTIAQCLSRSSERVHIQYAPAGAGRQAFGGRLAE